MTELEQTAGLLRAARAGDEASRRELLIRHEAKIRGLIRRCMGDELRAREESSDLVQAVLLDLVKDLDPARISTEDEFDRYLAAVTRNTVAQHGRKRRERESGGATETIGDPVIRAETGPFEGAAREEDRRRVRAAVERLPPLQQRVVLLREFERLPFAAIAAAMSRTEPAVQMLHHRAWIRLTQLLEAGEPREPAG